MGKVKVAQLQGSKVIHIDFSGLKKLEDIAKVIEESRPFIRNNPPKSIYTLTNIEGMFFNAKVKDLFSEFTGGNKDYVIAGAIIGASGLQNILINGINIITGRKLKSFPNEIAAKNWLVSQN